MCTFYLVHLSFSGIVELKTFPSKMLRWCLVCVIWNSQQCSFIYIQTLHNYCLHIEDMHLLFCAHSISISSFLRGVEHIEFVHIWLIFSHCWGVFNLDIYHWKCLGVSGLCNLLLQQFSFLYIQSLHNDFKRWRCAPPILCTFENIYYISGSVELRHYYVYIA